MIRPAVQRWPLACLIGGALSLTLMACGAGHEAEQSVALPATSPPEVTAEAAPSASESPAPGTGMAPLSGLPISSLAVSAAVVAVAVAGSSPKDLDDADIVYEELSDGLRWIALYQSRSGRPGPVTDTRPMDGMLLQVLHPVYVFSGGGKGIVRRAEALPLSVNVLGDHRYESQSSRVDVDKLRTARKAPPAEPLLPFLGPDVEEPPGLHTSTSITLRPPGHPQQNWRYDKSAGEWIRTSGGPEAKATNLVIQVVRYKAVQLSYPHGRSVPSARVFGNGRAVVATRDKVLDGLWRKSSLDGATTYSTSHGISARFQPGNTFIVLAPTGSQITVA